MSELTSTPPFLPDTATQPATPVPPAEVHVTAPKGRAMLQWYGKRAPRAVPALPAQLTEVFDPAEQLNAEALGVVLNPTFDRPDVGGLLLHGDNREVLGHLIGHGLRGKVKLIYIDPPFDSKADYVRTVELRGTVSEGAVRAENYTLGEQVQYSDIWSNDNYLQFMYERLLLLKETLAEDGSIWLHCDRYRSHQLRCLMDEVFGPEALVNEVIWQRTDPHNDAKSRLGNVHDTLLWYRKGSSFTYNWADVMDGLSAAATKEYSLTRLHATGEIVSYTPELEGLGQRFKLDDCTVKGTDTSRRFMWRGAQPSSKRVWPYTSPEEMDQAVTRGDLYLRDPLKGAARCRVSYLENRGGQVLQSLWTNTGRMKGGSDYPTEKPAALLGRIIQACTHPGELVLDAFCGSGVTLTTAQRLGRRWIGADINKGAIQLTSRRLQQLIGSQQKDGALQALPTKSLRVLRVNDYDLAIQHNEAVALACELIGVTRLRTDSYFDGTLGTRLVKIVPFNHPLSPADLEELKVELTLRPGEDRDVVLVSLGQEQASVTWMELYNQTRRVNQGLNHVALIELRTDQKYGAFIAHEPLRMRATAVRQDAEVLVTIEDVVSPTILKRLQRDLEGSAVSARISDWRSMVDAVLIDVRATGEVFEVAVADVPERRQDLVNGQYRVALPEGATAVRVKIIDCLGEEVIVQLPVMPEGNA